MGIVIFDRFEGIVHLQVGSLGNAVLYIFEAAPQNMKRIHIHIIITFLLLLFNFIYLLNVMHIAKRAAISSLVSTAVTYPLDSLKTQAVAITGPQNVLTGIEAPLVLNSLSDSIRLYVFNALVLRNALLAAAVAGLVNSVLSIPIDSYKLCRQTKRGFTFRGWQGIALKEMVGSTVYLSSVAQFSERSLGPIQSVVVGGCCGCLAMTAVYPIDTLRILYQTDTKSFPVLAASVTAGDLWRGYKYSLCKAFLGSASWFVTFSILKK